MSNLMKALLTLPASLLLALPALAQDPVQAADAPKVDPIIQKLIANLPKLAEMKWEAAQTLSLDGGDGAVNGTITMSFQDKTHFKCSLDFVAAQKLEDGSAGESQNIKATLVADGSFLWVNAPMLAQTGMLPETVKVELAVFEELAKMVPQMMAGRGGDAAPKDIHGMLADATKGMSFKEEGSTDALKRFIFSGGGWNGACKMDSATWFPMGVDISNEEGMKAVINTTSFAKKETFPEGSFVLSGVDLNTVMDLSGMIRMQLGALNGGGGEEDREF